MQKQHTVRKIFSKSSSKVKGWCLIWHATCVTWMLRKLHTSFSCWLPFINVTAFISHSTFNSVLVILLNFYNAAVFY